MRTVGETKQVFGMPVSLAWGFLAVFLFMVGDGVEQAFLSKYIVQLGFSVDQAALVFSVYGIVIAVASWFSGVLVELWGPRITMLVGFLVWVLFDVGFLVLGLESRNYPMMLVMYGLRGFGFPLFSFSFIVWISYVSDKGSLGAAMGWFWFAFAGGLGFIGAYYPSFTIPFLGYMGTLWSALAWIVVGGLLAIFLIGDRSTTQSRANRDGEAGGHALRDLLGGITILGKNPKVAVGGVVRTINTSAQYGFVVILPIFFTNSLHFTTSQWLQIWGDMSITNMIFNFIWGAVGDKLGWRRVVQWFGCIGCAATSLLFYYGPLHAGHNYGMAVLVSCLFGITLAAFVPLSAIMPSLEPENKGFAMSILNLGAGLSTFVGPAVVGLLNNRVGVAGIAWAFAILYIVSAILSRFLEVRTDHPIAKGVGNAQETV
ncbi:MFS transporter [Alicyclobacillus kakegawensis]|uniref:MFS transporter n=1 Tax=Alicyclobacillus kakegawensis TaxID=392012 RepID=UPI000835CE2C|nr:MFS transporter [Alicyclobacillus kakegawensis]